MLRQSKAYLWSLEVCYWLACYSALAFTGWRSLFFWRYPIYDLIHLKIWIDAVFHTNCTYHYLYWEKQMAKLRIMFHILRADWKDYCKDVSGWMEST